MNMYWIYYIGKGIVNMNEIDKAVLTIRMGHIAELCSRGTYNMRDTIEVDGVAYTRGDIWDKLDTIAEELMQEDLAMEEKEFLVQRALYLLNQLKEYYIGRKQ